MSLSSLLSYLSATFVLLVFIIPFIYKISDKRRVWYKKFSGWGLLMLLCVIVNAYIQILKDKNASQEQNKRDSTIAGLDITLKKYDSAVSKKFDSLGFTFQKNTFKLFSKTDSTSSTLISKLDNVHVPPGMP
jgi:glucan phosphoethanolaminetransferase (alkaline phosphatase superfamily)